MIDQTTGEVRAGSVTFSASLPPIGGAIRLSGNGDGARVQLDVPASSIAAVLELAAFYTGCSFTVTVEPGEMAS